MYLGILLIANSRFWGEWYSLILRSSGNWIHLWREVVIASGVIAWQCCSQSRNPCSRTSWILAVALWLLLIDSQSKNTMWVCCTSGRIYSGSNISFSLKGAAWFSRLILFCIHDMIALNCTSPTYNNEFQSVSLGTTRLWTYNSQRRFCRVIKTTLKVA